MLKIFYNFCWYAVGGLILSAAILVSIARLLLPGIGEYRDDIQTWISDYMGYPVIIQEVQADWRGWTPRLYLNGVKLLEPESNNTIAVFENAYLSVNPVKSLWQQEIVPETLSISGARLRLIRELNGSLRISESSDQQQLDPRQTQAFSDWLQQQPSIRLENVQLIWLDRLSSQGPLQLRNAKLIIRNDEDRMQIDGQAQLPQYYGNQIDFALDTRDKLTSSDWHGEIYLRANNLQPAAWKGYSRWQQLQLYGGNLDIELWSQWQAARLKSAQGRINGTDLLVKNNTDINLIQELATQFQFDRNSDGTRLLADISRLNTLHGNWPASTLQLIFNPGENSFAGAADFILLEDLVTLLPAEQIKTIQSALATQEIRVDQFSGRLHDVRFRYHPETDTTNTLSGEKLQLSSHFEELQLYDDNGIARISGINGFLVAGKSGGQIDFNSDSITIRDKNLLINDVNDLSLHGSVDWQYQTGNLSAQSASLVLGSHGQRARLQGDIHWYNDGRIIADVLGRLSASDLQPLKQFIPAAAKPKLQRWLQNAPVGGQLDYANFALRGDLNDFPFHKQQGQFQILARFSDVILDYNKKWTPVYQLNADLKIDRDYLELDVADGNFYDADISHATASMESIYKKNHVLRINGRLESPLSDIKKFLINSPLRDDPEIERLQSLQIDNPLGLELDLTLPLKPGPNNIVAGEIEFSGNHLDDTAIDLVLTDLQGNVRFRGNTFEGEGLKANYSGQPVTIDISREGNQTPLNLRMYGHADVAFLLNLLDQHLEPDTLQWPFADYFEGSTDWSATLSSLSDQGQSHNVRFDTNLEGIQIKLPAPLGKPAKQNRKFQLDWPSGQDSNEYLIDYADELEARIRGNNISIQLGSTLPETTDEPGLTIRGNTALVDIDEWSKLIKSAKPDTTSAKTDNKLPISIDLETRLLQIYDQKFADSRLKIDRHEDHWLVDVSGPEITGHMEIPEPGDSGMVTANFDRLALSRPEPAAVQNTNPAGETEDSRNSADDINSTHSRLDPSRLPALSIQIDDFSYGDIELGKFRLRADKQVDGLNINTFQIEKPGLSINGQGEWRLVNDIPFSTFNIDLEAEKFANMLATFGYSEMAVDDGPTELSLAASWPGAPTDFSLAGIQGELSLNIGRGQFLDIDPKAGRLFGLLSLQTLSRRLTLDFNDLFKKGFAFDEINGKFSIEDGHAYTNNLFMDGPSALIHVTGRAGLVKQDYDQRVTIMPQVSDNLPLASALFGPAGIGVGAVIYLASKVFDVIPRQLDRLLAYEYTITGDWNDPVITPYRPETAASVDLEAED
ncbi:MAG: YhdP family protein [Gammaproteobacteria bacterium]